MVLDQLRAPLIFDLFPEKLDFSKSDIDVKYDVIIDVKWPSETWNNFRDDPKWIAVCSEPNIALWDETTRSRGFNIAYKRFEPISGPKCVGPLTRRSYISENQRKSTQITRAHR